MRRKVASTARRNPSRFDFRRRSFGTSLDYPRLSLDKKGAFIFNNNNLYLLSLVKKYFNLQYNVIFIQSIFHSSFGICEIILHITKISSSRVNTTSRRGIKQLGISFGSIFLLFSYESSRGPRS